MNPEQNPFSPQYKAVIKLDRPPSKFNEASKSYANSQEVWSQKKSQDFRDQQMKKLKASI